MPLGELDPGAYALRVTQTRPGSAALGRTLGLVAPTAAEYRRLGTDEALLTTLRAATGGVVIDAPEGAWVHDLRSTTSLSELWPLLLVLALLLWPLDVALRRVSLGRRELAGARAWIGGLARRRQAKATRTATAAGLLAARDRAGSAARLALLTRDVDTTENKRAPAGGPAAGGLAAAARGPATEADSWAPASEPVSEPNVGASTTAPSAGGAGDTMDRLRQAKRRARDR